MHSVSYEVETGAGFLPYHTLNHALESAWLESAVVGKPVDVYVQEKGKDPLTLFARVEALRRD